MTDPAPQHPLTHAPTAPPPAGRQPADASAAPQAPAPQAPGGRFPVPQHPSLRDVPKQIALVNGSFEEPKVTAAERWDYFHESDVPGWSNTASDKKIELWQSGYQGMDSEDGGQHAELNATEYSTLYQ